MMSPVLLYLMTLSLALALAHGKVTNDDDSGGKLDSDDSFLSSENGICSSWICGPGEECRIEMEKDFPVPVCGCREQCPQPSSTKGKGENGSGSPEEDYYGEDAPVCGSDGIVYPSECEIFRSACLTENSHLHITGPPETCGNDKVDEKDYEDPDLQGDGENKSEEEREEILQEEVKKGKEKRGSSLCSRKEFQRLKEGILQFPRDRVSEEPKERLVENLLSKFDINADGLLEYAELQEIGLEEKLGSSLLRHCHPVDFIRFADGNGDGKINFQELQKAYSSEETQNFEMAQENNQPLHISGVVGKSLKIRCPFSPVGGGGIRWRRYGESLKNGDGYQYQMSSSDSHILRIPRVSFVHSGNLSCECEEDDELRRKQEFILSVTDKPKVLVSPSLSVKRLEDNATFECRERGSLLKTVKWRKNGVEIEGEKGPYLHLRDLTHSSTGAYECLAENEAGVGGDVTSLLVLGDGEDISGQPLQTQHSKKNNSSGFAVFHSNGISIYDPETCRLENEIRGSDIIPGTRERICGASSKACSWGSAILVSQSYIYATQLDLARVIVISLEELVVVDVISTPKAPENLYYHPSSDRVFLECFHKGMILAIGKASRKRKHFITKVGDKEFSDGKMDRLSIFIPSSDLPSIHEHAYVSENGKNRLHKLGLKSLRIQDFVDLSEYKCQPRKVHFPEMLGYVIIECEETRGLLLLDYMTNKVIKQYPHIKGQSFFSPDSKYLLTSSPESGINLHSLSVTGLEDGVHLRGLSQSPQPQHSPAFFPSQSRQGYDFYIGGSHHLSFFSVPDGRSQLVRGVGRSKGPLTPQDQDGFGTYLVTRGKGTLLVINGKRRTLNCQVGGKPVENVTNVLWLPSQR